MFWQEILPLTIEIHCHPLRGIFAKALKAKARHCKMKTYELNYLIPTETLTEEADKIKAEISDLIQKEGGKVIKSETTPKTLAYQIKNHNSALWTILEFLLNPEKLSILEEKLKKEEKIFRYLLITKKPQKAETSKKTRRSLISQQEEMIGVLEKKKESVKKSEKKIELKDIDEKIEEMLKE